MTCGYHSPNGIPGSGTAFNMNLSKSLSTGLDRWLKLQPLDRVAGTIILLLCLLVGGVIWSGDHTLPRVNTFSWNDRPVGVQDTAFILTFNRAMNWQTVGEHLRIEPPLPGKLSWSGRRLAYTLTQAIPYGQSFHLTLEGATAATRGKADQPLVKMQPFSASFHSRDRALVYLGIAGQENGRLVLHNLTRKTHQILTPPTLTVFQFKADPKRNRILFTAVDRGDANQEVFEQKLYAVPIPLREEQSDDAIESSNRATHQLLLDNQNYQILSFDITADGEVLVVQLFSRHENEPVSLWQLFDEDPPRQLDHKADGRFLLSPDGQTLTISQNQGIASVPLDDNSTQQPVDFWSKFDQVLSFAWDGSAALMAKNNPDSTRSLYLLTSQGQEQELLKVEGYLLDAEMDPITQIAYCLYTTPERSQTSYHFNLHISAVDLTSSEQLDLITLPGQSSGTFSLAPEGSALLYEQITITHQPSKSVVRDPVGQTISDSQIWLYPLRGSDPTPLTRKQPQKLLAGVQPLWLP